MITEEQHIKIGVFGGTFNPVHYGHLRAAEEAREKLSLERVIFIPTGTPPLKTRDIASPGHRLDMTRLAVGKNRMFAVLDIECSGSGKSYTVNTLNKLLTLHRGADLYFILGTDAFLDIPNWREPERLLSLVNFVVLSRPGSKFADLLSSPFLNITKSHMNKLDRGEMDYLCIKLSSHKKLELLNITPIGISSTDIRRRVQKGLSIRYLLPEKVEQHINAYRLYR